MALSDRALTAWAASGSTAAVVIVGLVAAFGGLSTVEPAPLTTLQTGATFESAPLSVTVERAETRDDVPEAYLDLQPGQQVVALIAEVTNTWTQPEYASVHDALGEVVTVADLGEPAAIVRTDTPSLSPTLQPGVPVEVMMLWPVDTDRFARGDDLAVTLSDMTLYTASFVTSGQWWTDPVPKATVAVPVEARG